MKRYGKLKLVIYPSDLYSKFPITYYRLERIKTDRTIRVHLKKQVGEIITSIEKI